jgi:hypothetical protein
MDFDVEQMPLRAPESWRGPAASRSTRREVLLTAITDVNLERTVKPLKGRGLLWTSAAVHGEQAAATMGPPSALVHG